MSTPSNARSIDQRLSLVGVGIGVDVHASMRLLSFTQLTRKRRGDAQFLSQCLCMNWLQVLATSPRH